MRSPAFGCPPKGAGLAWFIALQRENIKFDSKTWSPQIAESKRKWKEKKRLAKLKQAPE